MTTTMLLLLLACISTTMSTPFLFAHAAPACAGDLGASGEYEERFFNQTLDHFDATDERRWTQRYLFSKEHWNQDAEKKLPNGCPGPILFYTGNEGPITAFWESNGFMIDHLAPEFGALIVFAEERYYGASLPFGPNPNPEQLKYLSVEQILADYNELIWAMKQSLDGAESCPVVAFGGSFGGTLATFFRASYPATIVGALAASAPIGYYNIDKWQQHGVSEFTWSDIVTQDYDEAHPQCLNAIAKAVMTINAAPQEQIVDAFNVCEPAGLGPTSQSDLFIYALESLPQLDYPYPVGNLPAWPVNDTCSILVDAAAGGNQSSLIASAAKLTKRVLGISDLKCMQTLVEGPGGVPGDGPGRNSWGKSSSSSLFTQSG
eukprot:g5144.t1